MRPRLPLQLLREPELRGETLLLSLRLLARAPHGLVPRRPDLLRREAAQPHVHADVHAMCNAAHAVHVVVPAVHVVVHLNAGKRVGTP